MFMQIHIFQLDSTREICLSFTKYHNEYAKFDYFIDFLHNRVARKCTNIRGLLIAITIYVIVTLTVCVCYVCFIQNKVYFNRKWKIT